MPRKNSFISHSSVQHYTYTMYTMYTFNTTHHHNLEPHNIHSFPSQVQYIQNTFYNIFKLHRFHVPSKSSPDQKAKRCLCRESFHAVSPKFLFTAQTQISIWNWFFKSINPWLSRFPPNVATVSSEIIWSKELSLLPCRHSWCCGMP